MNATLVLVLRLVIVTLLMTLPLLLLLTQYATICVCGGEMIDWQLLVLAVVVVVAVGLPVRLESKKERSNLRERF